MSSGPWNSARDPWRSPPPEEQPVPRIQKPRSRSLDTEGVKFLQVKFAAMMNRRKDNNKRRGSQPIDRGSLSPSRSPISKMFGAVFKGDSGSRRESTSEDEPASTFETLHEGKGLCVPQPRGMPIPVSAAGPRRHSSAAGSPSSSPSVVYPHRKMMFPPYRDTPSPSFGLPPGTRRRNLSGGPGGSGGGLPINAFYGDYLRNHFPSPPTVQVPDYSLSGSSESESRSESGSETGSEEDQMINEFDEDNDADEEEEEEEDEDEEEEEEEEDCFQEEHFFKHEKGQLVRRHSMEPERKRNGSGSSFGHTYLRGEDPNQAAIIFRDCRGLPAAAPFLENVKRSELEMDESQILVKFFKYHTTYDLIPTSAKLVIFDTRLQVKKAFYALVYNGVRAAPLWDAERQQFVGMLTITDFIRILQSFYNSPNRKMEELEEHRLEMWRTLLKDDSRKLISITPSECLYEAIKSLIHHKIHRLPVIDPTTGNVLYIITHKRILKFLFLYINELPKPSILLKSLRELNIGTYENIETAKGNTLIIEALNKFVERRISALPIVDDDGKLIDIYAKFDVINLAAEGTYHNLDVTLHQANEYRNEWFEGVLKCTLDETMEMIMERIVRAEVHRLVVVDKSNKVIGIISLSDILNELVLKPCHDDPASLKGKTIAQMEEALNGSQGGSGEELTTKSRESLLDVNPQLNQLQTGSDDSMAKSSWDSGDARKEDEGGGGPSSSADSIEDSKFRGIGVTNITENLGQHEVGPISG